MTTTLQELEQQLPENSYGAYHKEAATGFARPIADRRDSVLKKLQTIKRSELTLKIGVQRKSQTNHPGVQAGKSLAITTRTQTVEGIVNNG
jgi:hypothetical protein